MIPLQRVRRTADEMSVFRVFWAGHGGIPCGPKREPESAAESAIVLLN